MPCRVNRKGRAKSAKTAQTAPEAGDDRGSGTLAANITPPGSFNPPPGIIRRVKPVIYQSYPDINTLNHALNLHDLWHDACGPIYPDGARCVPNDWIVLTMPAIAPGAEFIARSTTAASNAPDARSAASRNTDRAADRAHSDKPDAARGASAFDALVGLAAPTTTPAPVNPKTELRNGQATTGAGAEAPDAGPPDPGDLPQAATGQQQSTPALPATGQAISTPAHNNPTVFDGLVNNGAAPAGEADPATAILAARNRADSAPIVTRPVFEAGGTVQGGPAFVGDLPANDRPAMLAGIEPRPVAQSQAGAPLQANASPQASAAPQAGRTVQATAAEGTAAGQTPPSSTNGEPLLQAAVSAGSKPSGAKSLDADAIAKTAAQGSVTSQTAATAQSTVHGVDQNTSQSAGQSTGPDAKTPVMAVLSPPAAGTQAQAAATASTAAGTPAAPTTPVAGETTLATAPAAAGSATASGSTPAQAIAAGVVSAEANPAGRFAQARQGVDERDNTVAAARSKGKSATHGANASASQASGKHQAAGASPPPPSSATHAQAQRPDIAAAARDLPVSAPPTPPAAAAPLAADAVRMPTLSLDPALTATTDTGPGSVRGGANAAATAGTAHAPRFTPHTANQLAAQISQRFANGSRVFGIRLDPAELGRVDIRLELSHNNRVHATLTVERGDTLAEMQRSTRELERALNDAGLDLAEDGLTFQLSEGGDQQSAEAERGSQFNIYGQDDDGAQDLAAEIDAGPSDAYGFRLSRRDGVDLRV